MTGTESMYDFAGDYTAPTQSAQVDTPHQNRSDLSKPYAGTFAQKVKEATTESEPKTNASVSWWRFFTKQQDNNQIAQKINSQFNRDTLSGDNFASERQRYIDSYNWEVK